MPISHQETENKSMLKQISRFASVLTLIMSSLAAADTVTLFRVELDREKVLIEYEKDFDTCAHLHRDHAYNIVHTNNIFCETNRRTTVETTTAEVRVEAGQSMVLCHGNNGNICSEEVTVTDKLESTVGKSVVHVNTSASNINLKALFKNPMAPGVYEVIIDKGVIISSANIAQPALATGIFPLGSKVTLKNLGKILGAGGAGGSGGNGGSGSNPRLCGRDGQPGGNSIELNFPLKIQNEGEIFAGGGGGGGSSGCNQNAGGGGGAGSVGGVGGAGASLLSKRNEILFCGQDNNIRTGSAGQPGSEVGGLGGSYSQGLGFSNVVGGVVGGVGGNFGVSGKKGIDCVFGPSIKGGDAGLAIKLNGHATNIPSGLYDSGTGPIRGSVDNGVGRLVGREITITRPMTNVNVSELFGNPILGGEYHLSIGQGVLITSLNLTLPALNTGTFPDGAILRITNAGRIYGAGGAGGSGGNGGSGGGPNYCGRNGSRGGVAIELNTDAEIKNLPNRPIGKGAILRGGMIFGGGGGGAGASGCNENAGGGGGAGYVGGAGGAAASTLSKYDELAFCGQDNEVRTGTPGQPGSIRGGRGAKVGRNSTFTIGGNGGGFGLKGSDSTGCGANNTSIGGEAGPSILTHGKRLTGIPTSSYQTNTVGIRGPVLEE